MNSSRRIPELIAKVVRNNTHIISQKYSQSSMSAYITLWDYSKDTIIQIRLSNHKSHKEYYHYKTFNINNLDNIEEEIQHYLDSATWDKITRDTYICLLYVKNNLACKNKLFVSNLIKGARIDGNEMFVALKRKNKDEERINIKIDDAMIKLIKKVLEVVCSILFILTKIKDT